MTTKQTNMRLIAHLRRRRRRRKEGEENYMVSREVLMSMSFSVRSCLMFPCLCLFSSTPSMSLPQGNAGISSLPFLLLHDPTCQSSLSQSIFPFVAATEELVNLSNLSIKLFSTNTFSAIPWNRIRPCRRLPVHVICIAVVVITITKCVSSILLYVRWQSALRLLLFMPS